jgi:hypothetical protein
VTIDSIWFTGAGNSQIYLDNVMHNPNGLITPGYIAGDYDGDGLVSAGDYDAWRSAFGSDVAPWTGADGTGDGHIDVADYVLWRSSFALANGSALHAAAVPEPTMFALVTAAMCLVIIGRRRFGT